MIEDYYDEYFTPLTCAQTGDGAGGVTEVFTEQTSKKFKGKKELLSSNNYVQNLSKAYSAQYLILAAIGVQVIVGDIIRSATDGNEYDVLEVEPLYNHHTEIKVGI